MNDAVKTFRFYAGCTDKLYGKTVQNLGDVFVHTRREPFGYCYLLYISVVGLITPWNFPLLMALWKIAPALAAGNTIVIKPSEITTLTSLFFG